MAGTHFRENYIIHSSWVYTATTGTTEPHNMQIIMITEVNIKDMWMQLLNSGEESNGDSYSMYSCIQLSLMPGIVLIMNLISSANDKATPATKNLFVEERSD